MKDCFESRRIQKQKKTYIKGVRKDDVKSTREGGISLFSVMTLCVVLQHC